MKKRLLSSVLAVIMVFAVLTAVFSATPVEHTVEVVFTGYEEGAPIADATVTAVSDTLRIADLGFGLTFFHLADKNGEPDWDDAITDPVYLEDKVYWLAVCLEKLDGSLVSASELNIDNITLAGGCSEVRIQNDPTISIPFILFKLDSLHVFDMMVVSDDYIASEATCTAPGTYYYSCECGAVGTDTFTYGSPTGHSYRRGCWNNHFHWEECHCGDVINVAPHSWIYAGVIKQPTETETGLKRYVCMCGAFADEIIPALGHTHKAEEGWHTDDLNHWKECSCGEALEIGIHAWNDGVEKDGKKVYTCQICGAEDIHDIPVHSHSANGEYKHDDISHWNECDCGEKLNVSGHVWVTDRVENGTIYSKCAICGHTVETPENVGSYDDVEIETANNGLMSMLIAIAFVTFVVAVKKVRN